jgi:hypothetical protein
VTDPTATSGTIPNVRTVGTPAERDNVVSVAVAPDFSPSSDAIARAEAL